MSKIQLQDKLTLAITAARAARAVEQVAEAAATNTASWKAASAAEDYLEEASAARRRSECILTSITVARKAAEKAAERCFAEASAARAAAELEPTDAHAKTETLAWLAEKLVWNVKELVVAAEVAATEEAEKAYESFSVRLASARLLRSESDESPEAQAFGAARLRAGELWIAEKAAEERVLREFLGT